MRREDPIDFTSEYVGCTRCVWRTQVWAGRERLSLLPLERELVVLPLVPEMDTGHLSWPQNLIFIVSATNICSVCIGDGDCGWCAVAEGCWRTHLHFWRKRPCQPGAMRQAATRRRFVSSRFVGCGSRWFIQRRALGPRHFGVPPVRRLPEAG